MTREKLLAAELAEVIAENGYLRNQLAAVTRSRDALLADLAIREKLLADLALKIEAVKRASR